MGKIFEKSNKYDTTVSDAMYLWGLHGKKYRNLLSEYNRLLEQKRALKLALRGISKKDLDEFPEIEFLYIEGEVEAKEYLESKTPKEISRLCEEITNMVQTNYVYRTLCSKIDDFAAEIRKKLEPKKDWYAAPIQKAANTENPCKRTCSSTDDFYS